MTQPTEVPTRSAQEAYEALVADVFELEGGLDSNAAIYQFCLMRDLEVAWAAAKVVFGDAATPADAWKIHDLTHKEMCAYAEAEAKERLKKK